MLDKVFGGTLVTVGLAALMLTASAEVVACSAKSGPETAALVELYTSEGCDSCPPADRWLSSAFPPDGVRTNAVALAFHVDYWDRLGWKDRFATPAWTERQYASARASRSSLVYTPQVLVQGKDFQDWRGKGIDALVAATNAKPARANVALEAQPRGNAVAVKATARIEAAGDRKDAALFIALADSRLVSEVKAGENAGARLTHDHVVREFRGGIAVDANGDAVADLVLPLPAEPGKSPTVVAFVQNKGTGAVLQALELLISAPACVGPR
jgi:hypothetical protein